VEAQADTSYEAAVMAAQAFREHHCEPGPGHKLEIEAGSADQGRSDVGDCAEVGGRNRKSPAAITMKKRVKAMLNKRSA